MQQRFEQRQQLQQFTTERTAQQHVLQKAQSDFNHLSQQLENTQKIINELAEKGQHNSKSASTLIFELTGTQQEKPNEWLKAHDQKRQQQQHTYSQLKQHFEQSRQNFESHKNQLDQIKIQQQQHRDMQEKLDADIRQWLNLHSNFEAQDLAPLLLIDSTQEQQIRQQLQHAERLLNDASSALKTLHEQLTEHLNLQPDCDFIQLQQQLQQHLTLFQAQREHYNQLNLKLELHQQNVLRQQKFTHQIENIQQQEHRWGKFPT